MTADPAAEREARWQAASGRLRTLLEEDVALTPVLRRAVAEQSQRYRSISAVPLASPGDVDAYLASRMPATMAAVGAAMRAVAQALPSLAPRIMLDVGTGTGSAPWAATAIWPSIAAITALDRSQPMLDRARRLAAASGVGALAGARWVRSDLRAAAPDAADLVTATYLLGELPEALRLAVLDRLWAATAGVLVIVEPGSPEGFARVRAARTRLIAAGASVAAPCPHDAECPMPDADWCHFGARLSRSRLHRRAKGVARPFEDEPYAYVAVTRQRVERAARVLARPQVRAGIVGLRLCTVDGIRDRVVSRREGPAYREARHAGWGSPFAASATKEAGDERASQTRRPSGHENPPG